MIDDELKKEFRKLRKLIRHQTTVSLKLLAYYEQLAEQYEELRVMHNKNHGSSMLPIQLLRKKTVNE